MDSELARKIAAAIDLPGGPEGDSSLEKELSKDPAAKKYARELGSIERALRGWPDALKGAAKDSAATKSEKTESQWEAFAKAIEARLDDKAFEGDHDEFLASPFPDGDDDSAPAKSGARTLERKAMSQSQDDKNDDDDLEGLAALVRSSTGTSTSLPPPAMRAGPALTDDEMDENSGVVDIKHLAELARRSVPPIESVEKGDKAEAKSEKKAETPAKSEGEKSEAKGEKPEKKAAAVPPSTSASEKKATPAPEPAEKKGNPLVWAVPVALAAGIGLFVMKNNSAPSSANVAASEGQAAASAPVAEQPRNESVGAVAREAVATASPAAQEQPTVPGMAAPVAAPMMAEATVGGAQGFGGANAEVPRGAPRDEVRGGGATGGNSEESERASEGGRRAARVAGAAQADRGTSGAGAGGGGAAAANARPRGELAAAGAPASPEPSRPRPVAPESAAPSAQSGQAAPRVAAGAQAAPSAAASAPGAAPRARSVEDLMAAAVGRPSAAPTATAAPSAALPDRLSRTQVSSTMTPLSGAVRACTQGANGTATVAMVIQGDGTVQSANVSGPFGGGVNECIAGVVRRAHFPQFARPTLPVVYPFVIQPREE